MYILYNKKKKNECCDMRDDQGGVKMNKDVEKKNDEAFFIVLSSKKDRL